MSAAVRAGTALTAAILAAVLASNLMARPPGSIPVWIEDSHAGSFYFLASEIDPHTPHTLLLIDAHSDASAARASEDLRWHIRHSPALPDLFKQWRKAGRVQCYDWIEPLLPSPVERVFWLPPAAWNEERAASELLEARAQIDARLDFEPRETGALASRFSIIREIDPLHARWREHPVIVSLDLDVFAGLESELAREAIADLAETIARLPRLRAVTVAVSRPYLTDDAEADRLVAAWLEALRGWTNIRLCFEPLLRAGPDHSAQASAFEQKGNTVPAWSPGSGDPVFWQALQRLGRSPITRHLADEWQQRVDTESPTPVLLLEAIGTVASTDQAIRLAHDMSPDLTIGGLGIEAQVSKIEWFVSEPLETVRREGLARRGADEDSPSIARWRERLIATTHGRTDLPWETWSPLLAGTSPTPHGTLFLSATIYTEDDEIFHTPVRRLEKAGAPGLLGEITRGFGLPYLLGSSWLDDGHATGPEAGRGADCANFLLAALRRHGWLVGWGHPSRIPTITRLLPCELPSPAADAFLLRRAHVAFRPANTENLLHQLDGPPEWTTYEAFAAGETPIFLPAPPMEGPTLLIGGDTVPTVETSPTWPQGPKAEQALRIINLECALAGQPRPGSGMRFLAVPIPSEWQIAAVSLANNHVLDGGAEGLLQTMQILRENGTGFFGAGIDSETALAPWRVERDGVRFSFFGICLQDLAHTREPGVVVADLPLLPKLLQSIREETAAGRFVVVIPHWGAEWSQSITNTQRQQAAAFVASGARLIAASGTHLPGLVDYHHGAVIAYALGDFHMPQPSPGKGQLLQVTIDRATKRLECKTFNLQE